MYLIPIFPKNNTLLPTQNLSKKHIYKAVGLWVRIEALKKHR
nr:MAG TPA: hypothetical protein [Caudoviricetes sp.]